MTLPAYAEELKRLNDARPFDDQAYADVAAHVELHLDRILRDVEIAEAAREYAKTYDALDAACDLKPWDDEAFEAAATAHEAAQELLRRAVAKETP